MKTWLVIAAAVVALTARGADWQDTISPAAPGNFPLPRPVRATYRFGWSALPAADAVFDFTKPKPDEVRLDMSVKTTGAVRTLFRLDAQHTALAQAATLRPISARQTEVYKDETLRTKLDFDDEGVTRSRRSSEPTPGNGNEKRFKFSPLFDLHTALLWVRSQRLQSGDVYRLVVYPSTAPYLAEIAVGGVEKIKVGGKTYSAFRLGIKLRRVTKKLELQPHSKFKRATAWVSDDSDRMLVKVEAEIFVGSVWVELRKAEFPAE